MPTDRTFVVVSPYKSIWEVRFKTEEAGWSRLIALKAMHAKTVPTRASLEAEGWKVRDTTEAPAK